MQCSRLGRKLFFLHFSRSLRAILSKYLAGVLKTMLPGCKRLGVCFSMFFRRSKPTSKVHNIKYKRLLLVLFFLSLSLSLPSPFLSTWGHRRPYSGVLNDQFFEKGLFLSQTTNWRLSSDICLIINFRGKKIAAPQHQQAEIHRIPFASKQLCGGPESQPEETFSHCLFPVIWDPIGPIRACRREIVLIFISDVFKNSADNYLKQTLCSVLADAEIGRELPYFHSSRSLCVILSMYYQTNYI